MKSESSPSLLALFNECLFWSVLTGSVEGDDTDTECNLCNSTSFLNRTTGNHIRFDTFFVAVKRSSWVVQDLPVRDLTDRSTNPVHMFSRATEPEKHMFYIRYR